MCIGKGVGLWCDLKMERRSMVQHCWNPHSPAFVTYQAQRHRFLAARMKTTRNRRRTSRTSFLLALPNSFRVMETSNRLEPGKTWGRTNWRVRLALFTRQLMRVKPEDAGLSGLTGKRHACETCSMLIHKRFCWCWCCCLLYHTVSIFLDLTLNFETLTCFFACRTWWP